MTDVERLILEGLKILLRATLKPRAQDKADEIEMYLDAVDKARNQKSR